MNTLAQSPDSSDRETGAETRARLADAATRYTSAAEYREHEARDFAYSTRPALLLTDAEVDSVWPADSSEPAAISARLDAEAAASLAAHRERITALARRAARIGALPTESARHAAYDRLAVDLFNDGTTWIAGAGFSLDTTDGVTSVKIALDDQHFALLDPAEANRAMTTLLGLTLAATGAAR